MMSSGSLVLAFSFVCIFQLALAQNCTDYTAQTGSAYLHYVLPSSCLSSAPLEKCNTTYTTCLKAFGSECGPAFTYCATQWMSCVNHAVFDIPTSSLCSWGLSVRIMVLGYVAGDSAAYTSSCIRLMCDVQATLSSSCNGSPYWQGDASICQNMTFPSKTVTHALPPANQSSITVTLQDNHSEPYAPPTVTKTLPIGTQAPIYPWPALISELRTTASEVNASMGNIAAEKVVISPLPSGCPSFLSSLQKPNSYAGRATLAQLANGSLTITQLMTQGNIVLNVQLYYVQTVHDALLVESNAEAAMELNATIESIRDGLALADIHSTFSYCFAVPTSPPPTTLAATSVAVSTLSSNATTALTTLDASTIAATTSTPTPTGTSAEPFTLPSTPEPTINYVPYKYVTTVTNGPTAPFKLEKFRADFAKVMNTSIDNIEITVVSMNKTATDSVLLDIQFIGNEIKKLQDKAALLTSTDLLQAGIIGFAPEVITTPAPDTSTFLKRSRSLIWVGGAGFVGFAVLCFLGYQWWRDKKRRQEENENEVEMGAPLLNTPRARRGSML